MAVGLYSGVSGLALGIGLYRNVSGLWGGASGLIDGFGGADPYAGASLYLNFLDPTLDSRIAFSRGTNATLIDSTGRLTYAPNNLVLWSQDFENAYWARTAATVTANTAVAPDGTTTADTLTATANGGYIAGNWSSAASGNKINSIWIKRRTGTGAAYLYRADGAGAITINPTSEWVRYTSSIITGTAVNLIIQLQSNGDQIDIWGAQGEVTTYETTARTYNATTSAAYYGPRFDYDPVTLAPRGLLIEEARTNLLTYSDDWSNAAWVKQQVTISTNVTLSPDGTANADKIAEDNTTAFHRAYQTINKAASAITYVYTVYIKAAERTTASVFIQDSGVFAQTDINLVTGALSNIVGTVSATNAGNGWWRVSVSGTSGAFATALCMVASNNGGSFLGTTGSGIYVWGAQAEAASFATSYIPTVASTVTRNADVATMTGTNFSSWYNAAEGSFVLGAITSPRTGSGTQEALINLTATIRCSRGASSVAIGWFLGSATFMSSGVTAASTVVKTAGGYSAGSNAASTNGAAVTTDAGSTYGTPTQLDIGNVAGGSFLNGHIRTIAYFNTRLPNAQLQTLTAPSLATTLSLDFTTGSYNVGF